MCLVLWCTSKGKIPGINYFCLTKKRHDSWLRALGRDPNAEHLSEKNVICSKHFAPNDVYIKGRRVFLKPNAVPSLFLRKNCGVSTQEGTCQVSQSKTVQNMDPPIIEKGDDLEVFFVENKESADISVHISCTPTIEIEESSTSSFGTPSIDFPRRFKRSYEDSSTDSEGNEGEIKHSRREIKTRHNYNATPSILLRKLTQANMAKSLAQKKVKLLKVQVDRLQKKVTNLKQTLWMLKREKMVSKNGILEKSLTVVPLSLMKRTTEVKNK